MASTCPICSARLPWLQKAGTCSCPACGGALLVQDKVPEATIIVLWIVAEIPLSLLMPSAGVADWLWWLRTAMSAIIGAAIWLVLSRTTRIVLARCDSR